tara:strand:+ start:106932 stop:107150 length:219 start_codon:yes stop_codon:yes gene_type:complete
MKNPYPFLLSFKKKFTRDATLYKKGEVSKEQQIGMVSIEEAERYIDVVNNQNEMGNLEYKIEDYTIVEKEEA